MQQILMITTAALCRIKLIPDAWRHIELWNKTTLPVMLATKASTLLKISLLSLAL